METIHTLELTQEQIDWLKYAVANSSKYMWDYTLVNSINEALNTVVEKAAV